METMKRKGTQVYNELNQTIGDFENDKISYSEQILNAEIFINAKKSHTKMKQIITIILFSFAVQAQTNKELRFYKTAYKDMPEQSQKEFKRIFNIKYPAIEPKKFDCDLREFIEKLKA